MIDGDRTDKPTIPAPACPLEQAFEEDMKKRGGWSEKRKAAKPTTGGDQ